jgi:hypothetical protein
VIDGVEIELADKERESMSCFIGGKRVEHCGPPPAP